MLGAAFAISLASDWPKQPVDDLITWADAYVLAAERLHEVVPCNVSSPTYAGPIIQNTGIATELTLKALVRGAGYSEKHVRQYSHNTYRAYLAARAHFDEPRFLNLVLQATAEFETPREIVDRLTLQGETDPARAWRIYFSHLRVMDTVYDKPYRSRYVAAGPIILPETTIVIAGTRILLAAMQDRLSNSTP